MIALNSSVHHSTLHIFDVERYVGWSCILNSSHPPPAHATEDHEQERERPMTAHQRSRAWMFVTPCTINFHSDKKTISKVVKTMVVIFHGGKNQFSTVVKKSISNQFSAVVKFNFHGGKKSIFHVGKNQFPRC